MKYSYLLYAGLVSLFFLTANAASVSPTDLQAMKKFAADEGAVRVSITLDRIRPLESDPNQDAVFMRNINLRKERLLAELGDQVFRGGSWTSPTGQIGLTLRPRGIAMLESSQNALSFQIDTSEKMRRMAHDIDGSLSTLKAAIKANGQAEAEIILAVASARYEILKDGTTKIFSTPEMEAEVRQLSAKIVDAVIDSPNFKNTVRRSETIPVAVIANVDLAALIALQDDRAVRALRPLGYKDPRPATWSPWAMEDALREGEVEVGITLRGGLLYTNKVGWNSAAGRNQARANRQALQEILGDAGIKKPEGTDAHDTLGTAYARLTPDQFARLQGNNDARILAVTANRAIGEKAINISVPMINAPAAWLSGVRGADQTIVVMDEGIRKSHDMFNVFGFTKVVAEDCFGSRSGNYRSPCVDADLFGDSPANTPNSGEPFSNIIECQLIDLTRCGHGTWMASIAAGRSTASVDGGFMQGVAPDAKLHSINIFSYNTITFPRVQPKFFATDLERAVVSVYTLAGANDPDPDNPAKMIINLSVVSVPTHGSDCDSLYSVPLNNYLGFVVSAGVPVISSTGNYGIRNGISYPACSQNVIKVGAVPNDGIGLTPASYSNLAPSTNYSTPIFLAPGGEKPAYGVPVTGAGRVSDSETLSGAGTSQAAAHVSGMAALFKGRFPTANVQDFIAWINAYASVPVEVNLPAGLHVFRRVNYSSGGSY